MARDSATLSLTLKTPTLKFEPVILRRRSTDDAAPHSSRCGLCSSDGGKTALRGAIDCCDHTFCFVCIVMWANAKSFCPSCNRRFTTIYGPSNHAVFASKRLLSLPQRNQAYHDLLRNATSGLVSPSEEVIKCSVCHGIADESRLRLLCDICDSAVHTYCVGFRPALSGAAWFCHECALSGFNRYKTGFDSATAYPKTSGNVNTKLPSKTSALVFGIVKESNSPVAAHHNPSFSFLPGRRTTVEEANVCRKNFGKGHTKARLMELEQLVQSLQQKIEGEQAKRVRLEDQMEQLIERGVHERINQQIEEKFQQHFDKCFTRRMQQILLTSSKSPV